MVGLQKAPVCTLFPSTREAQCPYEPCHLQCLEGDEEGIEEEFCLFAAAVENMTGNMVTSVKGPPYVDIKLLL